MEAFEKLVSLHDYPMYVVTTRADDESAGCLVGFTSQVSIGPPPLRVAVRAPGQHQCAGDHGR